MTLCQAQRCWTASLPTSARPWWSISWRTTSRPSWQPASDSPWWTWWVRRTPTWWVEWIVLMRREISSWSSRDRGPGGSAPAQSQPPCPASCPMWRQKMKQSDQIPVWPGGVQLQGQMLIVVVESCGEYTYLGCSEIKTIVINLTLIVHCSSFKNSNTNIPIRCWAQPSERLYYVVHYGVCVCYT